MNAFPRTATSLFSRSTGELARLLFKEKDGGSFRVLRAMYRFDDRHYRGDLIDRLLMQSPAVKAARNRRKIAQRMLEVSLRAMPPGRPILVLAIGGGDGSLEAEVIARSNEQNVYYLGIDRDERAVGENREVLKRHGLEDRGGTLVGSVAEKSDVEAALDIAERRFNVRFDGVSVCVCQGIVEYLDLHSDSNETLHGMLNAVRSCMRPGGRLIVSQTDHHDRVKYLEDGLSWHMRLRSSEELADEVQKAEWRISVCKREPMELITMCLAVKPGIG
jgi:SAM-dependent methyltransferase